MTFFIFNERPNGTKVSASEFIQKGKILMGQITRHGLGSGVYGYARLQERKRKGVVTQKLELKNPVILDTKSKFNKFVRGSTRFNKIIQEIIKDGSPVADTDINDIKSLFKDIGINIFKKQLLQVIEFFLDDYRTAKDKDFLVMPINYICSLANNGPFDGIYNSIYPDDSGTGSILFKIKDRDWNYPRHWLKDFDNSSGILPFGASVIFMSKKKVTRPKIKKIVFN